MRDTARIVATLVGGLTFVFGVIAGAIYLVVPWLMPSPEAHQVNTMLAAIALPGLVLGGALLRELANARQGRASGHPQLPPVMVLLLIFVGVVLLGPGALRDGKPGAYVFPLLFVLGIALPLLMILRTAVYRSPAVVTRELTAQLGYGAFVAPVLAILFESIVLVVTAVVVFGLGALLPQGRDWLTQLGALAANPAAPENQAALQRLILTPPVLTLAAVVAIIAGPLIEELIKVLGVIAMEYRHPGRSQVLVWGLAAGAGFALTEGLMSGFMAATQWPSSVGLRIGASLLHATATAITALGWFEATSRGRRWILPLAYLAASALHGWWNALGLATLVLAAAGSTGMLPERTAAPLVASTSGLLLMTVVALLVILAALILWATSEPRRATRPAPEPGL